MWYDCRIQLGELGANSPSVLVMVEGHSEPVRIDSHHVQYDISDFAAEREWGTPAGKPADCFQTGVGWVRYLQVGRSRNGRTRISIPRLHELALVVHAADTQLWDGADVRARLAA